MSVYMFYVDVMWMFCIVCNLCKMRTCEKPWGDTCAVDWAITISLQKINKWITPGPALRYDMICLFLLMNITLFWGVRVGVTRKQMTVTSVKAQMYIVVAQSVLIWFCFLLCLAFCCVCVRVLCMNVWVCAIFVCLLLTHRLEGFTHNMYFMYDWALKNKYRAIVCKVLPQCQCLSCSSSQLRPDMTSAVDWVLKANYLYLSSQLAISNFDDLDLFSQWRQKGKASIFSANSGPVQFKVCKIMAYILWQDYEHSREIMDVCGLSKAQRLGSFRTQF